MIAGHEKAIAIVEKAKQELEALGYKPDMQASISFNHNKHGQSYKHFSAGLEVHDYLYDESVTPEVSEDALS